MTATPAAARVADDIRRHGPVPFRRVVERALYDPEAGFYEVGGRSGRREGHFVTSPEVGALFGAVVARMLDERWRALGEPPVFVVVEPGAGPGTLCRTVLAASPACAPALRYVLVERSAAQRRLHAERLRLEDPALAFPPVDPDTEVPVAEAPEGPICVSLAAMPRLPGPAVVLANELLDNLPFGLAERRDGGWCEVRVDLEPGGRGTDGGTRFVERLVPFADDTPDLLDRLAPGAAEGARVPVQEPARDWLRDALAVAGRDGLVVVFDYVSTTAEMAARPQEEWLRTYRGHRRGVSPLADLGTQDITCEVAVDQLALVREPDLHTTQAEWLRAHGVEGLVEDARRTWRERAHIGDLAAVAARSRVTEADALLDPAGLGGFAVLEWRP